MTQSLVTKSQYRFKLIYKRTWALSAPCGNHQYILLEHCPWMGQLLMQITYSNLQNSLGQGNTKQKPHLAFSCVRGRIQFDSRTVFGRWHHSMAASSSHASLSSSWTSASSTAPMWAADSEQNSLKRNGATPAYLLTQVCIQCAQHIQTYKHINTYTYIQESDHSSWFISVYTNKHMWFYYLSCINVQ